MSASEGGRSFHPRFGASPVRIVVLGAGYGGLSTVLRLVRRLEPGGRIGAGFELTLVDEHLYHLLKTRLHEAAVTGEKVAVRIEDVIRDRDIRFVNATVQDIDLGTRVVHTSAGRLSYDVLVIALGSQPSLPAIAGLREHALPLRSCGDASAIRRHLRDRLMEAEDAGLPGDRARLRRVVIAGGGFAGVELAAELHDRMPLLAGGRAGQIILLEAGPRLLPGASPVLSRWAEHLLQRRGIRVLTGTRLTAAEEGRVHISPGGPLAAGTLVWLGGVRANEVLERLGAPTGRLGRLMVDNTLQLLGAPGVYAIGDAALALDPISGREVALTARHAAEQGRYVADTIAARLQEVWAAPYQPGSPGNRERYLGMASLALSARHGGRARTAAARVLRLLPAALHLWRLRAEWHRSGRARP